MDARYYNEDDDPLIIPGPTDPSILDRQRQHRSTNICDESETEVLDLRTGSRLLRALTDTRRHYKVEQYIILAGLYGFYRLGSIQVYKTLITSLVERWRMETHTFHMPVGECTVTLEDISAITGLPVDGEAVTGTNYAYPVDRWIEVVRDHLGIAPPPTAIRGNQIRVMWLLENFLELDDGADDLIIQNNAKASVGRFSWGGAVLSYMYRELCKATKPNVKEIAGPMSILQIWDWERFSVLRPIIQGRDRRGFIPFRNEPMSEEANIRPGDPYGCMWRAALILTFSRTLIECRDQLDIMIEDQITWKPYPDNICCRDNDREIWRARVPLICFDIVELHFPDRVMRQFGMRQNQPEPCNTSIILHNLDRRGRAGRDWRVYHNTQIELWNDRRSYLVNGELYESKMHPRDAYMQWYQQITRHPIGPLRDVTDFGYQPTAASREIMVQNIIMASQLSEQFRSCTNISEVYRLADTLSANCRRTMNAFHESYRIVEEGSSHEAAVDIQRDDPMEPTTQPQMEESRRYSSRRRRPRTRDPN